MSSASAPTIGAESVTNTSQLMHFPAELWLEIYSHVGSRERHRSLNKFDFYYTQAIRDTAILSC